MQTKFITIPRILETGTDLVSPHLRWLLRHAIVSHCSYNAIDVIAYHKNIPKSKDGEDLWGETYAPAKAIAINLEKHFDSSIEQIQEESKMNTSLRCVLIRELLDTAIHEAHHLKISFKTGDFSNSKLEEKEAAEEGWNKSWMAAKYWDADITVFGPVLDSLLEDFFTTLEEDTKETPVMWKDLQVYMWKNKLAFYDPDKDYECNIKEAFEAMAKDDNPWIDDPKQFLAETVEISKEAQTNGIPSESIEELEKSPDTTNKVQDFYKSDSIDETGLINMGVYNNIGQYVPNSDTAPEPLLPENGTTFQEIPTPPQQPAETYITPTPAAKEPEIYIPPPPPATPAMTNSASAINVLQIQQAVEAVLRTLFAHIITKCGYTTDGRFNNPTAVLEAVSILHIPHAKEIFSHMDTTDATGVYAGNQPCNGFIKGLVSKQDLPMYRFYLNIGGQLCKRTFIPQNPDKLNANGELTTWAKAVRTGAKIMMLLEDNAPPKAHLKLDPGMKLGQEEFKIWGDK